jgi:ATP-dependent Clp protease protease subunit
MNLVTLEISSFYDDSVRYLKASIDKAKSNNQKILPILVNSYGGSVMNLFRMIDLINSSDLEIITICHGVAMSAGAVLFAMGKKRYISENSNIMIHDVGFFAYGKHSEVKSSTDFAGSQQDKAYSILDSAAKKETGFFENLVKENKGADLYLSADKSLEIGLATDKGIPSTDQLLGLNTEAKRNTPYQNFKILMEYSSESRQSFDNENNQNQNEKSKSNLTNQSILSNDLNNCKSESKPKDNKPKKEGQRVSHTIESLLNELDEDKKKPVLNLQAQVSELSKSFADLNKKNQDLSSQLTSIQEKYEQEMKKISEDQDKDFISSLIKDFKLSKKDEDKELKMLSQLSSIPEVKATYKEKLLSMSKIVPDPMPTNGERNYQFEDKPTTAQSRMEQIAKEKGLDMSKTRDVEKVMSIYAKEIGG